MLLVGGEVLVDVGVLVRVEVLVGVDVLVDVGVRVGVAKSATFNSPASIEVIDRAGATVGSCAGPKLDVAARVFALIEERLIGAA